MLRLPADLAQQFSALLDRKELSVQNQTACLEWLRFYWDFCDKYHHDPNCKASLPPLFAENLEILPRLNAAFSSL